MSKWDWVQWYEATLIAIHVVANLFIHGRPKEGLYDFRVSFVGLVVSIPIIGRIFLWW
jgi:hypothetical protein